MLDNRDQVHIVILVHIPEVVPKEYKTAGGDTISESKARRRKFIWRNEWFSGQNFHSDIMQCYTEGVSTTEIVEAIKKSVMEGLLEEDEKGELVPPLLHALDVAIYIYKRRGEGEVPFVDEVGTGRGENTPHTNQEVPAGKRKRSEIDPNEEVDPESKKSDPYFDCTSEDELDTKLQEHGSTDYAH